MAFSGPFSGREGRGRVSAANVIERELQRRALLDTHERRKQEHVARLIAENECSPNSNLAHIPITPAQWFVTRYPGITEEHGDAVLEETDKNGVTSVTGINEDFLAATLGWEGATQPTVYVPEEQRFFTYMPDQGIYVHQRESAFVTGWSQLLLQCARACRGSGVETQDLEFRLRDAARLLPAIKKAKGQLEVRPDFFATDLTELIAVSNGIVRLADNTLLPFSPSYRRRNKLAISFDPNAKCPQFLKFLHEALEAEDIDTFQKCCGQALTGSNVSQKIVLMVGLAGTGKTTIIKILRGVIGADNFAMLRTALLTERFEISRCLGKTVLYAPDVDGDFLNHKGAAVLKSLTGHDPLVAEFKNSNETPTLTGNFNVLITCNSRLMVRLQGDVEAWRRRLVYFDFHKPKPEKVITDLDQQILKNEGPGVLNWMLEGLAKLRDDGWQLHLTASQQAAVDNLLLESDGHTQFVREEVIKGDGSALTVNECFSAYAEFCNDRGWATINRNKFGQLIGDVVTRTHGKTVRNDIPDPVTGKAQRGWRGLRLKDKRDSWEGLPQ